MPGNETTGIISLNVDKSLNRKLRAAEDHLKGMAASMSQFERSMANVSRGVSQIASKLASSKLSLSASFGSNGMVLQFEEIAKAQDKVMSKAALLRQYMAFNKADNRLSESYAMAANSLNEMKEKYNELNASIKKMVNLQRNGNVFVDKKEIENAKALLNDLDKKIKQVVTDSRVENVLKLPIANSQGWESLDLLQNKISQIKRLLNSNNNSTTPFLSVEQVKLLDTALEDVRHELDLLKNETSSKAIQQGFDRLFNMSTGNNLDKLRNQISQIQSAINSARKQMDGNPLITQGMIDDAQWKLDSLRRYYNELYEQKRMDKISRKLDSALGLDDKSVDQMKAKIVQIKKCITQLREESAANGGILPTNQIAAATQRISELRAEISGVNANLKLCNNSAQFLRTTFRTMFPAMMLTRVIRDLVNVRGEFEMSQRSLEILTGDVEVAGNIFNQLKDIAIKSPFQVKDLVKQTKQLAAFRIETDKLVETEKMLGDISAGLGVDMNRLILAYGQVKAATVLKGTELRQFSEAGVNMLGGLADRFSELQGRMVTTGEVLSMISKKMVSFADVDAVLRSQTEAGGTFYDMQAKQAETIKGMISNLRDRLDIMFNEIGTSTDGFIKGFIKALNWLMTHYKALITLVGTTMVFKTAAGAASMLGTAILNLGKNVVGIKMSFAKTVNTLLTECEALSGASASVATMGAKIAAAAPYFAAATAAVLGVGFAIAALTKERREFNSVIKKGIESASADEANFLRLESVIKSSITTDERKREALEEMKQKYGDILPIQDMFVSNLDSTISSLDGATEKLREHNNEMIRAKALEQMLNNILGQENKSVDSLFSTLKSVSDYIDYNVDDSKQKDFLGLMKYIDKGDVMELYKPIQEGIINGVYETSRDAADAFIRALEEYVGLAEGTISGILGDNAMGYFASTFRSVFTEIKKSEKQMEKKGLNLETKGKRSLQEYTDEISDAVKATERLGNKQEDSIKDAQEVLDIMKDKVNEARKLYEYAQNNRTDDIAEKKKAYEEMEAEMKGFQKEFEEKWSESGNPIEKMYLQNLSAQNYYKKVMDKANAAGLSDSDLKQLRAQLTEKLGPYMQEGINQFVINGLNKALENSGKALANDMRLTNILTSVDENGSFDPEKMETELNGLLLEYERLINTVDEKPLFLWTSLSGGLSLEQIEESRDAIKDALPVAKEAADCLRQLKAASDTQKLKERQQAIKGLVNEIRNYVKEFDNLDDKSRKLVEEKLEILAKESNISLPEDFAQSDIEEWYEKIKKNLDRKDQIEIELAIDKEGLEKQIGDIKDNLDSLWDKYETAKKARDYGITLEGFDENSIYQDIIREETRLSALQVKNAEEAANASREKRLAVLREEQLDAARIISEANKKALSKVEQAYTDMFEDIGKIESAYFSESDQKISSSDIANGVLSRISKGIKDITDAEWEAYKGMEQYTAAFGDLDLMSGNILKVLKEQLEGWAASQVLDPSEVKTVKKTISEIADTIEARESTGFFSSIRDGFKKMAEARDILRKSVPEAEKAVEVAAEAVKKAEEAKKKAKEALELNSTSLEERIGEVKKQYEAAKTKFDSDIAEGVDATESLQLVTELGVELGLLQDELENLKKKFKETTDESIKKAEELSEAIGEWRQLIEKAKQYLDSLSSSLDEYKTQYDKVGNAIESCISLMEEFADVFGLTINEDTLSEIKAFAQGFNLVGSAMATISAIAEGLSVALETTGIALGTVMWPLLALGAAIGTVAAAVKANDNKIVRSVEKHQEAIDELAKSYEKLKDRIDDALNYGEIANTMDSAEANIQAQKDKLEEMIALEESRGAKKDDEAIKGYKDQIESLDEELLNLKKDMMETLGLPSSYNSLADDFASSWLSAFKDTGDGLSGLQDAFDKMYEDIVAGQIKSLVMATGINELKKKIEDAMSDYILTNDEVKDIENFRSTVLASLNEQAKAALEALGVSLSSSSSGDNETLQKGIKSITETQASALESYLNSIRFYVSQNNSLLQQIVGVIGVEGDTGVNPMLAELKAQTAMATSINSLLVAVSKNGHPTGGKGIRVFTDIR